VWNELAGGDNEYAAAIVAVNSSLQLVLYSPLSYLFLSILPPLFGMQTTTLSVSFASIAISVAIYLGIPFVLGLLTWALLRPRLGNERYFSSFIPAFGKLTLFSLLFTVAIMFSLQSQSIIANPLSVVRVAVPLLVYFALMFGLSLLSSWALRIEYSKAVTLAFTAASNNFGKRMPSPPSDVAELAIAVAVATFGVKSNAAFAAVVGPLVEIPVMLALVYVAKAVKRTFDRRHHVHAVELKDVTEGD
jgi:arsenite transporter